MGKKQRHPEAPPEPKHKKNGIARLEDFRRAALANENAPEPLTLPKSGLTILVRRPTPQWYLFKGRLPSSLAAIVQGQQPKAPLSREDDDAALAWINTLLAKVIVEPRELLDNLDVLETPDRNAIVGFAHGVLAPGEGGEAAGDLESFRPGSSGGASVAVAGGRRILTPAK